MMHMRHSCNGIIVCNMESYWVLRLDSNTELYPTMLCLDTTWADLTHWGRVTHICVGKLTIIGAVQATSHYLNQCWNIVNWTIRNKLQWNSNRNLNIFIQENALENGICEMVSIMSWPQCVKHGGIANIYYHKKLLISVRNPGILIKSVFLICKDTD